MFGNAKPDGHSILNKVPKFCKKNAKFSLSLVSLRHIWLTLLNLLIGQMQERLTYLLYKLNYSQLCVQIPKFLLPRQQASLNGNNKLADPKTPALEQKSRTYLLYKPSHSQYWSQAASTRFRKSGSP